MNIDFDKVNVFVFEMFFQAQYKTFLKKCQAKKGQDSAAPQSTNIPAVVKEAAPVEDSVEALKHQIGLSQSSTFTSSYKCIEGYLGKEIDTKKII